MWHRHEAAALRFASLPTIRGQAGCCGSPGVQCMGWWELRRKWRRSEEAWLDVQEAGPAKTISPNASCVVTVSRGDQLRFVHSYAPENNRLYVCTHARGAQRAGQMELKVYSARIISARALNESTCWIDATMQEQTRAIATRMWYKVGRSNAMMASPFSTGYAHLEGSITLAIADAKDPERPEESIGEVQFSSYDHTLLHTSILRYACSRSCLQPQELR
jgi:hypothetical protein